MKSSTFMVFSVFPGAVLFFLRLVPRTRFNRRLCVSPVSVVGSEKRWVEGGKHVVVSLL